MYPSKPLAQWRSEANFLKLTLFLFNLACSFCAAAYTLLPRYALDGYSLYTLALILLAASCAGVSLYSEKHDSTVEETYPQQNRVYALCLFFLALGLGLYRIDYFSIWLDEEIQADATKGLLSIVKGAAFTQMPLSYFFTALNISWLGLNEWGLRIIPCLFYAGSCSLFSLLISATCRSRPIQLLAPVVYMLNPWLIHYAQEGRPYAMMLFCGVLWLLFVRAFLEGDNEKNLARDGIALFSATLLFFLSISFQPVVLALALLPALGLFAIFPIWRKKFFLLGVIIGAATLLVLPLIYLSRERSITYLQPSINWASLSPSSLNFSGLFNHVSILFRLSGFVWALVALVLLVFVAELVGKSKRQSREGARLALCFAMCASFTIIFWGLFSLLVRYNLRTRYFLICFPLGLLTISLAMEYAVSRFSGRSGRTVPRLILQLVFFLILLLPAPRDLSLVYSSNAFDRWNDNYRSMYEYLRLTGKPGDVAYYITVQDPYIEWEQTGFVVSQFYYAENTPVALANHWEIPDATTTTDLILKDLRDKKPSQIFLVYPDTPFVRALFKSNPAQPNDFMVHRIPVKESMSAALTEYFTAVIRDAPETENAFRVYDILLHLAEHDGNAVQCADRLKEMRQIKSSAPKLVEIFRKHEALCASIRSGRAKAEKAAAI